MKKVKFIMLILLMFILIFSYFLYFKNDSFDDLVINKISSDTLIDIGRKDMNTNLREQKYIEVSIEVEKFRNMLDELKLLDIKSIPEYNGESIEMNYYIDIVIMSNDIEKEYIYLQFYKPGKYIDVEINNKNRNIKKTYEIINGSIDFDLLDKLIIGNVD